MDPPPYFVNPPRPPPNLTLPQLRSFYTTERRLYIRLLRLGISVEHSRRTIAFWFWLETQGFSNVISWMLRSTSDALLVNLAIEAFWSRNSIMAMEFPPAGAYDPVILMRRQVIEGYSLREVLINREDAIRTMDRFYQDVCLTVFADINMENLPLWVQPFGNPNHPPGLLSPFYFTIRRRRRLYYFCNLYRSPFYDY